MAVRLPSQRAQELAKAVEQLCRAQAGVPIGELVGLALSARDFGELSVRILPAGSDRVAFVWAEPASFSAGSLWKALTHRQQDVAQLLLDGASNKEIAARLGISVATVKDHVHQILDRLGCESRGELISLLLGRREPDV